MNKGIEFIFKDGSSESYDPIVEFNEFDDYYRVHNGFYEYIINKEDIVDYYEYAVK